MRAKIFGAFCLCGAWLAYAQGPQRFEAVSVRPSNERDGLPKYTPGRIAGSLTLRRLLLYAYGISPYQLSGGPGWINSDVFAIEAKSATAASPAEMRPMLQTLLAERFKLVVRRETRKVPVYTLTVARGGAKLREIEPGDPVPTPAPADPAMAHVFFVESMHDFVERLNGGDSVGKPVVDRTGLSGVYVFDFLAHSSADLVDGIQDQSGLRFEPAEAAVETVTVESAAKPDPD